MLTEIVFGGLTTADLAALVDREDAKHSDRPLGPPPPSSTISPTRTLVLTSDLERAFGGWRGRCRVTCGQVWRAVLAERLRLVDAYKTAYKKAEAKHERDYDERRRVEGAGAARHAFVYRSAPAPLERTQSLCERLCAIDAQPIRALLTSRVGYWMHPAVLDRSNWSFYFQALDEKRSVLGVPATVSCRIEQLPARQHTGGGRGPVYLELAVVAAIGHHLSDANINVWNGAKKRWSDDLEADRLGMAGGAFEYR